MTPDSPGYLATRRLLAQREAGCRDAVRRRQVEAELDLRGRFESSDRRASARIPPPASAQRLWQQHKYAVLARDERAYRQTGPAVARGTIGLDTLAAWLEARLVRAPSPGGLRNAVEHMWGHVSDRAGTSRSALGDEPWTLLEEIGREAVSQDNRYLLEQVALTELFGWHDG